MPSQVIPAAVFAPVVRESYGGKTAVFNIEKSRHDDKETFFFKGKGPCEETLVKALGIPMALLSDNIAPSLS